MTLIISQGHCASASRYCRVQAGSTHSSLLQNLKSMALASALQTQAAECAGPAPTPRYRLAQPQFMTRQTRAKPIWLALTSFSVRVPVPKSEPSLPDRRGNQSLQTFHPAEAAQPHGWLKPNIMTRSSMYLLMSANRKQASAWARPMDPK